MYLPSLEGVQESINRISRIEIQLEDTDSPAIYVNIGQNQHQELVLAPVIRVLESGYADEDKLPEELKFVHVHVL